MRRRTLSAVALTAALGLNPVVAGCSIPGSEVVDGEGIIGTYTVNGVDAVGIEYSGTVTIDSLGGDRYSVQWIVTGAIHEGEGRLVGDRLEVSWTTVARLPYLWTGTAPTSYRP